MSDFWYACDPEWDEALGPMSRPVLDRLLAARRLPRTVLVWHPDHAEWLPGYSGAALAVTGAQTVPTDTAPVFMPKPAADHPRSQGQKPAKPPGKPPAKPKSPPPKPVRPAPPIPTQKSEADTQAELKANQANAAVVLRRLGARIVDVLLVMPVVAALLIAWTRTSIGDSGPETVDSTADSITLTWLGLVLAIPAEALMLAIFGTTPGKALFGLRVRAESGGNPGLFTALGRQISIFVRGFALGIPVLNLITVMVAGVQTLNEKRAPWDRKRQLVVDARPLDGTRLQFAIIALVLAFAFAGNNGAYLALEWFSARWFQ